MRQIARSIIIGVFATTSAYLFTLPAEISTQRELDELLKAGKPVVVKFYGDWCGPCKQSIEPFKRIAKQHEGTAQFATVNTKNKTSFVQTHVRQGIPTFIIFSPEGTPSQSRAGFSGESDLANWVQRELKSVKKKAMTKARSSHPNKS